MVSPDAEWCGQCYARLDRAGVGSAQAAQGQGSAQAAKEPQGQVAAQVTLSGSGSVRRTDRGLLWTCPRCDSENPIEWRVCSRCGTKFERLFGASDERPKFDPDRAMRLSLLFPGAGHIAAGRAADGIARAVVFVWTALTAVTFLVMRGGRPGPFLAVLLPYVAAAVGVYAVSVVDARRAAEGDPPVVSSRMMLYGVVGLILFTVATLFLFSARVR